MKEDGVSWEGSHVIMGICQEGQGWPHTSCQAELPEDQGQRERERGETQSPTPLWMGPRVSEKEGSVEIGPNRRGDLWFRREHRVNRARQDIQ